MYARTCVCEIFLICLGQFVKAIWDKTGDAPLCKCYRIAVRKENNSVTLNHMELVKGEVEHGMSISVTDLALSTNKSEK